jgi:hypothetical protein
LMYVHVFVKVGPLRKSKMTAFLWALEGTFTRMNSEMIKKVMPFLKGFVTFVVSAK